MDHDPVTVVTSAGRSGTEDRKLRERRYALTQLTRVTCFVLAVTLPVPLWAKLVLIVGAFTLPWMGVMAANAGPVVERKRSTSVVERYEPTGVLPIEPGRTIDQE
ncbi:MAG: DUF3099 domain-containing protein [Mycobacteriales bacterium]